MANNSIVRKYIVFHGYVQGVGFRYRARHAADLYGCTGWVRNEWDGSVSMEIQGEESQIDQVTCSAAHGKLIRHKTLADGDGECNYWILGDKDPAALADVGSK